MQITERTTVISINGWMVGSFGITVAFMIGVVIYLRPTTDHGLKLSLMIILLGLISFAGSLAAYLFSCEFMKGDIGRIVTKYCWGLAIAGVFVGTSVLIFGMISSSSVMAESVTISLALACVILPYCLARGVAEILNKD